MNVVRVGSIPTSSTKENKIVRDYNCLLNRLYVTVCASSALFSAMEKMLAAQQSVLKTEIRGNTREIDTSLFRMKDKIEKEIRKAINRHLVIHVKLVDDTRDRIDILVDEASNEIIKIWDNAQGKPEGL